MAKLHKLQSDAFRGLLQGVNFAKDLQTQATEEERYQEQQDFRNQEFAFRKEEAKQAGDRWRQNFAEQVRQFGIDVGLKEQQMKINDENADADRAQRDVEIAGRQRYTDAMTAQLGFARTQQDKLDKAREDAKKVATALREAYGAGQGAPEQVTGEDLYNISKESMGKTNIDLKNYRGNGIVGLYELAMNKLGLKTSEDIRIREGANKTAEAMNAQALSAHLLAGKLPKTLKALEMLNSSSYSEDLLKQPDIATYVNDAASNVSTLLTYIKDGTITDPTMIKNIKEYSKKILPYVLYRQPSELETFSSKEAIKTENKAKLEEYKYKLENPED